MSLRPVIKQGFLLLVLASLLGVARQFASHGIAWNGRWPTSATSAEDAYKMMAREGDPGFVSLQEIIQIQENKSAILIDARSSEEYKAGHLPHARSLPYYEMEKFQTEALQNLNSDSPMVIYCEGVGCELSFFLGRELKGMGYTNIRIFYGGFPEWKNAGLQIEK